MFLFCFLKRERQIRSMRLTGVRFEEKTFMKSWFSLQCQRIFDYIYTKPNLKKKIFFFKSKPPPNTIISTFLHQQKKNKQHIYVAPKSSYLQLIVLVRPFSSVLRHCLCLDRGGGGKWGWGPGEAAVSLMLRGSNAAPPGTKLDVWRQVSYQQAAQPPNPNTASSCYTQPLELPLGGNLVPFGSLVCLAKWKPN